MTHTEMKVLFAQKCNNIQVYMGIYNSMYVCSTLTGDYRMHVISVTKMLNKELLLIK